jgi:hypothetical protein
MATKKLEKSENLDDRHIERVISLLEPKDETKPITKKDACQILNITYNTTRLGRIIEEYKEKKTREAIKRAEKRGTPASEGEVQFTIQAYLEGSTIDSISKSLYRSANFINAIIEKYGVPKRQSAHSYFKPTLIPDECVRESFKVGEIVYSARYDSMAKIYDEYKPGVYRCYLTSDKWHQYCYQPAEELASLDHLRKIGVNV